MIKIGIVFFSGTGTTRAVAEAVRQGVTNANADYFWVDIAGSDIVEGRWQNDAMAAELDECDAIIFGTPTYMGSVSAQLKAFMDAMAPRWFTNAWNGKLGAAFTVSSLQSGDKLNALTDITTFAMQMGMLWIGTGVSFSAGLNPNGFYLGVGASASSPDQLQEVDVNTATFLGERVAQFAAKLSSE